MNRGRRIIPVVICILIGCVTIPLIWLSPGRLSRPYHIGDDAFNLGVDRGITDTLMGGYDTATLGMDLGDDILALSVAYSPIPPLVKVFYDTLPIFRPPNPLQLDTAYEQDTRCVAFAKKLLTMPEKEQAAATWTRFLQGYKVGHDWIVGKGDR